MGLIPGWERSPGGGQGNPFQYSCLENPRDRGAWRATVHEVAESDTTEQPTLSRDTEVCGRMKPCIHMAEFLCCSPETIATFLSVILPV